MKSPTFLRGAGVALILSLVGAALFFTIAAVAGSGLVLRGLIALLSFFYVLWLLRNSRERTGRIAIVVFWLIAAALSVVLTPPLTLYVLIHAGLIWLIRSLYFYSAVVPALMDLGLSVLAVSAAVWAAAWSGSVFLTVWCFFLVQALFVAIPSDLKKNDRKTTNEAPREDGFRRAHRAAEAALKRLATHY